MRVRARKFREAFGLFVQRARRASGESQLDFAIRAGVSPGYIQQMERGIVPSRDKLVEIAETLGEDLPDWLEAAGYHAESSDVGPIDDVSAAYFIPEIALLPIQGSIRDYGRLVLATEESASYQPLEGTVPFGVRVETDSLAPLYLRGDVLEIHPNSRARTGQTVVVESDDGRLLAIYCGRRAGNLLLRPVNAPANAKGEPGQGRIVAVVTRLHRSLA